jgi:glycosyltransferase 2 family protein
MAKRRDGEAAHRENERKLDRAKYTVVTILVLSLAIFAAIAMLAVLNEGAGRFLATLTSINPFYYFLALACVFAGELLGFPKWELFIRKLGVRVDRLKNLEIYLSMFSMEITPGRWGRAVVSYTLNRHTGVRFARTFPAVVADIFTDFLGFVILALVSAFLVHTYALVSLAIIALLLIPFIFIYVRGPFEWLKGLLGGNKRFAGFFEIGDAYFDSNRLLGGGTYAYAMVFTLPSMLMSGLALYFVILSFGVPIGIGLLPTVLFVYTSAMLLGMVSGMPGALGLADAAFLGYLVTYFGAGFGVTLGVAAAITIMFRVASIWFVEGVGSVFLVRTMRYWESRKGIKRKRA